MAAKKKKSKSKKPVPTKPALWSKAKSEAKRKFKVYPSAYANAYAVKVCKGDVKGPDGKRRTASGYSKSKKKTTRKKRG